MQLPPHIRLAIDQRAHTIGLPALKQAHTALSAEYREGRPARIATPARLTAYLVTRMPATYSAAHAVLTEIRSASPSIANILDVGAGSGAASLAARELFPSASITLLERDPAMLEAARSWLPDARILTADATQIPTLPPHDLVIASYSLGEFASAIAPKLWHAAQSALAIIEPGTPRGFAAILAARNQLLAGGAHMLAPCPFAAGCPMHDPDWCHFAARVERSSTHRRLKDGDLGFEDEKFSYIALSRHPAALPPARVVRRPRHQPGLIQLDTCTPSGLRSDSIRKRDAGRYREARRTHWGAAIYHGLDDESRPGLGPSL